MSDGAERRDFPLQSLQRRAAIVGGVGLGLWMLGWIVALALDNAGLREKVFFSYLFAFCFSMSIPLGCLAIWMLHNQTGGVWGLVLRRALEAGARTIPFMAILFVPLAFGLGQLYPWVHPQQVQERAVRHVIEHRAAYMNPVAFLIRTAIYFALWSAIALRLDRWQIEQDRAWNVMRARRMQDLSGPGLLLYGLAVTFAAIDWLMSLEPEFFSTIYGVLIAIAQALPAYAFAVVIATHLTPPTPSSEAAVHVEPELWNDVGNLMLALVMLWAYMSFAQLLLVWSGNLPEEIVWYLKRSQFGWQYVAIFLAVFYFAAPFSLLLSRALKRDPARLRMLALVVIAVSAVHFFWLITPVYAARIADNHTGGPITLHWLDVAALAGVGGTTLAIFLWQLGRRPLTPPTAPVPEEEAVHHA